MTPHTLSRPLLDKWWEVSVRSSFVRADYGRRTGDGPRTRDGPRTKHEAPGTDIYAELQTTLARRSHMLIGPRRSLASAEAAW